jgi:hypothetical protein
MSSVWRGSRVSGQTLVWRVVTLSVASFVLAGCSVSTPKRPAQREDATRCYDDLKQAGVRFEKVAQEDAVGIEWPIRLSGPVGGIRIYGAKKNAPTNNLDCRLALALVEWAPHLKRRGVVGLQHFSMYRHDAKIGRSSNVSGHALGRAIDIGYFDLSDGRRLSVLEDWKNRTRGVEPCEVSSKSSAERAMRELVCEASEMQLFQMVLTPHYNAAHANHVHLEIVATDDDSWVG